MSKRSKSRSRSPSKPVQVVESFESNDTLNDDDSDFSDDESIFSDDSSAAGNYPSYSGPRIHTSQICNLIFPVPRIKAMLKVNTYANRVSNSAAVFMTSVLEYATTEILELSLNSARLHGTNRINPKHIHTALKTDKEFFKNFKDACVVSGGFMPYHAGGAVAPGIPATNTTPAVLNPSSSRKRTKTSKKSRMTPGKKTVTTSKKSRMTPRKKAVKSSKKSRMTPN